MNKKVNNWTNNKSSSQLVSLIIYCVALLVETNLV